jgi:hypothetical protein
MNNTFFKNIFSVVLIVFLTTISIKAWNWLTASQGDKLDYQKWNQLVATVQSWIPSWAVMAFNLPSCPFGWTAYSNWVWRTVIWAWNGAWSTTSVWDTWWEKSAPAISLNANLVVSASAKIAGWAPQTSFSSQPTNNAIISKPNAWAANIYNSTWTWVADIVIWPNWWVTWTATWIITWWGTAPDNMQPYVALLYCQKN